MRYFVGVDEAGYGPNFGPLLISASVWAVDDFGGAANEDGEMDFYARLGEPIVSEADSSTDRLAIADSKVLYQPSRGLAMLERGVLACVGQVDTAGMIDEPMTWRSIWSRLAPGVEAQRDALPWYVGYDPSVPVEATWDEVRRGMQILGDASNRGSVRLVAVRSRPVFPRMFNEMVSACATKAAALSELSVGLVGELVRELSEGSVAVTFDKHGGRSRYAGLLQHEFPEGRMTIEKEGREESRYELETAGRVMKIRFCTGGERFLPTAVASMVSKYLRELAMRGFNAFWCQQLPDLKPTAGYPQDARRFKAEIAARQAALGIDDSILWRMR